MAGSKNASKKKQKRGIDFKKIKRKIGRKLPPAQNATNTEIKSKAIVLPEQSVASEKAGLAVNKKGLTLKELLQQTSHYSSKVRKDALLGIKDLFLKHPEELRLHKYAVIEKLRERIGDDDRLVRETLYQLFKSVIFPGFKEDNQELFVSLMMAYIFNSMTHLAIDVRLMAFKILELVIQYYPPSFFLYAEKILQNFEDILRKNQFYLEDKSKLKNALSGLEQCLLLLPCNKKEVGSCEQNDAGQAMLHAFDPDVPAKSAGFSLIIPKLKDLVPVLVNCFQDFIPAVQTGEHLDVQSFDCMVSILHSINHAVRFFVYMIDEGTSESRPSHGELDVAMLGGTISMTLMKKLLVLFPLNMRNQLSEKDDVKYFVLDSVMTEIFLHLSKWICPPSVLLEKFLEFLENALLGKICSDRRSGKAIQEKHLISLLPFVPKLVSQVANDWKSRLLQAFTKAFKDCNPVSSLKLACLSTMEEMVVPRQGMLYLDPRDPEILNFQIAWIRELPMLLILLGDKNTSHSQVVLHLLLRLGQRAFMNYSFALEYDNMQFSLQEFFCIYQDDGNIIYGPFVRLPRESQELSLCCLRYISNLDLHMLRSIAYCCLCPELEQYVIIRVIEILHSAYKSGHIQIADHISFFITLLSRFRVLPENVNAVMERDVNISNRGTFKSITGIVCSCLSQMGDSSLVFKILEKMVLDQMLQNLPLDNVCAMLRMLIALDSEETIISEQAFVSLVKILPRYLIDIVHCIAEDDGKASGSLSSSACCYYLVPCFFLFVKSHKLLRLVLKTLGSWINESLSILPCDHTHYETDISSRVEAIISVLLLLHKDDKIWQIMSSFKAEIDCILQSIISIQSSEEISVTLQEKNKLKCAHDRLKNATSALRAEMQSV
ncbi:putative pre-rRNA-processing protein IPI1/Testis-expressed sequence 10 protein [Rosa chinensis]|uniref:Putative pre-rRNA-processing protein IPI1/Testis-expressed sequence 10 protein n=1 Tax=Rosa chinensis TaxID=74649 RepID=A0A2P6RCH6_ROSCH|nr:uncharacterized protein LOC112192292 [Rosa chinensis]XP_040372308.1 uncharacterized protein LOC112192292 [Rosa chinensis]PRQ44133.1 putative pre-rRNA-processing protein IPI1/Testis-expressed sequence 10 protein [Rosa chinensis]